MKEYRCAAYTMMGRRTRNQDNFLLNGTILETKHSSDAATASGVLDGPLFLAVVDGAGTKTTGERASKIVCEHLWSIREQFEDVVELEGVAPIINNALEAVNKEFEEIMYDEPTSKIGATAAILLIYNGRAIFGNVGDSAVYIRRDGVMTKLTCDHTEGEELIARGALTRDMLKNHSSKTKVTRKIGYMSFGKSDIMQFYDVIDIKDGDVFFLASPGVVQFMSATDIDNGLQTCIDVGKSVERVVKSAFNDFESKDNITAITIRINDEVDNVGNKNAKVKPIRSKNIHVHTSMNIDPEQLKKLAYIMMIAVILLIAVIYIIKEYPRTEKLKHVPREGYSWSNIESVDFYDEDSIDDESDKSESDDVNESENKEDKEDKEDKESDTTESDKKDDN